MNITKAVDANKKIIRDVKILLIDILIVIVGVVAHYVIDYLELALRSAAIITTWIMGSACFFVFAVVCIRMCKTLYSYPRKTNKSIKLQKICSVTIIVSIVLLTILISFGGLIYFSFTVKKEITIDYKENSYIKEPVSASVNESKFLYYKIINPFFYSKEQVTEIITIEHYTGIVKDRSSAGGDNGSVMLLYVDVGVNEVIEFTAINDLAYNFSQQIPVGTKVEIECEHHPSSEYRPILKIKKSSSS